MDDITAKLATSSTPNPTIASIARDFGVCTTARTRSLREQVSVCVCAYGVW